MELERAEILGRKVDLNSPQFLSHELRDRALAEAEVQYFTWGDASQGKRNRN
jgi:predicted nucleotidyltransferase